MSGLDRVRIVLVNTTHPGNIGAVARAMKNMGLRRLYLVQPRSFPDQQATARAASADDVLDAAVVTEDLDQAIADCSLVVGTSARGRRIPWPLVNPRQCVEQVWQELPAGEVALIFGREDRGLKNEELQRCNVHVHIPTNEEYSSLNLAMAVQILCYELRMRMLQGADTATDAEPAWDVPFAGAEEMERFMLHLEQALTDMAFLNPKAPKQLMTRLRRLYMRTRLDEMEVNIMRGVLSSAQYWVKKAGERETP